MLQPGATLSHYRLIEKIGAGGMGVVWKAADTTLPRDVAIKVLPSDVALDEERRRMFLDEAKLACQVKDAHVAQIYELGHQDDTDFIVMEYVEGKPLGDLLAGGALSPEKVADLGEQVARALSRAHRKGLIHRDLKPGNILVTEDGEAKVVDFGLATLFQQSDETMLTQAPTVSPSDAPTVVEPPQQRKLMGTLPYMSPEQVNLEKLDARSDIFSLGTVLYEMVTGQLPFVAPTASELMQEVRKARPAAPHELEASVPPELESIVTKAMAPKKGDRYQHAEDLAVDLKRLGRQLETGTLPSQVVEPEALPARRLWIWIAVASVMVAVLAMAIWRPWIPSVDPGTLLIVPLEVRGQDVEGEFVGRAVAEALAVKLATDYGVDVPLVPDSSGLAGGTGVKVRAARAAGAGRLLSGVLTRDGGKERASVSLVDSSTDRIVWGTEGEVESGERALKDLVANLAREIAVQLGATAVRLYDFFQEEVTSNEEMARSPTYIQAFAAVRRWDFEEAVPLLEKLIEAFPDEPDALLLGVEAFSNGAFVLQEPALNEKAIEACRKLEEIDPAAPWGDLCRAYSLWQNDPEGKIVDALTQILARDDLSTALRSGLLADRGMKRQKAGNADGAIRDWEEALRIDPLNVLALVPLAWQLVEKGRIDEGLEQMRKAYALAPDYPGTQKDYGEVLFHFEMWEEARAPLQKFCELLPRQEWCAQYAYALHRLGEPQAAREVAERAGTLEESFDGLWVLASYWALAGDEAKALEMLRRETDGYPAPIFFRGHLDFSSLRDNPEFEALAAAELQEAVAHYGDRCSTDPWRRPCALHAVALHLSGRESEAADAAARAASLPEPDTLSRRVRSLEALAWYHALARNRDEVIDHLRRRSELLGHTQVPVAWSFSTTAWRLAEHRDYAWLRGDPEFDALAAQLGNPGSIGGEAGG